MTKECIYCASFFRCEKKSKELCLNFLPRDKESEELHREWLKRKTMEDRHE